MPLLFYIAVLLTEKLKWPKLGEMLTHVEDWLPASYACFPFYLPGIYPTIVVPWMVDPPKLHSSPNSQHPWLWPGLEKGSLQM